MESPGWGYRRIHRDARAPPPPHSAPRARRRDDRRFGRQTEVGENGANGLRFGDRSEQLASATFAGWVNRHQAQVVDYVVEENRVLKEQLGGRRLRLTDDQRRRLAAKGKVLPRRLLARIATIVTPEHDATGAGIAQAAVES